MIFKSHQVNLDPEPFVDPFGERMDEAITNHNRFAPRPEFEPTRDPYPWRNIESWKIGSDFRTHDPEPRHRHTMYEWSPRRDQFDTPVNPILVDVRKYRAERLSMNNPKDWAHVLRRFENACGTAQTPLSNAYTKNYTLAQIAHARKVLTRLAALSKIGG